MNDIVRRVDHCRVCDADDWIEVISFGSHPLANGFQPPADSYEETAYPLDVIVCRRCRLMSIRHVIDPEVLFGHYVYLTSDSAQITGHMRHVAEVAAERSGMAPGDLVVELGSNIGTQLGIFQEAGMRAVGVDPARNLAEVANRNGVPTFATFFGAEVALRIEEEHGRAKFVLGRQCFAHIDDVQGVLDGVNAVIAPDGVLAIEVPYLLDLLDDNQFDTIFHEHLSYYSLSTLTTLFARKGLRVIDVERAPVHGGSIIVFATPESSPHGVRPSVAELRALETTRGIGTDAPYLAFAERTERAIGRIRSTVRELVGEGKRVAGYGAPSKGCALLQFCGLTAADIDFCTDTTVRKQGTVTPGTHIPVLSPADARRDPPDYYLLLAWNYAEEILAKESEFLRAGGGFIVPIPLPAVVTAETVNDAAA
ncbi:SAM-dependent methyltransferase [Amycolatopsis antarctica]|uniref:SAM-dependent methyltransferase n=1 Tax=Amycolatopsis antarctica TaxID=1854586 RepID=A0A263D2M9_9PSEU|nr:class I SAM-dependent methyltransferase [Amycolatopsis antarctica]OZM71887.1 SAM-dependent methyltransferase [Amycolatopsis antarctica]